MPNETMGEDLPPVPQEQVPSEPLEAEVETTSQIEVIYGPNAEELELQALDEDAPADPWSVMLPDQLDATTETEKLDPLQLTRVEETGLDTNRVTQRIERLLDPVQGNQKNDTGKIIIRHLRRALRRLEALEEGVQQVQFQMATLEKGLRGVETRLPEPGTSHRRGSGTSRQDEPNASSQEETGPFG